MLESDIEGFFNNCLIHSSTHSRWTMAQFDYRAYYDHNVVFVMEKFFDLRSMIALDDITVSPRACSSGATCDFDEDMCSFYFTYKSLDDYEFARMICKF